MANLVSVKRVTMVKPSEETPTCVLSLSAIDSQLFLRFTIEYLLVYRSPAIPAVDRATTATRVASALSRALVPYYPLAGRVVPIPDGTGRLRVTCEGQGACFVEAVADSCTVSDFQEAPRHVTQWRKLLCLPSPDVLSGGPPMVVQLTWLKDGGAALGVGIAHCLCDGIGSADFLNFFADLATGRRGLADIEPSPVWERHLLDPKPAQARPRDKGWVSHSRHPEFNRVEDVSGFLTWFNRDGLLPTSVCFGEQCLSELKNHALATSPAKQALPYSSFEALTAHVWRSWARALDLAPTQTLRLLFSVNVRARVKPNLPGGFYGNGFVLGCAETSAKELTESSLGHAASLVRAAKERVGDEYVDSVVEAVSGSTRACPDSVGVLVVSQWSRLGLEKVDFGMGRPVHVRPILCDRYCLLLPVFNRRDAVKVMVAVPTNAASRYECLIRSPHT